MSKVVKGKLPNGEPIEASSFKELGEKIQQFVDAQKEIETNPSEAAKELSSFGAQMFVQQSKYTQITLVNKGALLLPIWGGRPPAKQELNHMMPPECIVAVRNLSEAHSETSEWLYKERDRLEITYDVYTTEYQTDYLCRLADGNFCFKVDDKLVSIDGKPYRFYTSKDRKQLLSVAVMYKGECLLIHSKNPLQII